MSSSDTEQLASLDAQHDKYVGLMLAVSSSLMIGISFVITKKGLIDSTVRHGGHGSASDQYLFLKNPIWLLGMLTSKHGRGEAHIQDNIRLVTFPSKAHASFSFVP